MTVRRRDRRAWGAAGLLFLALTAGLSACATADTAGATAESVDSLRNDVRVCANQTATSTGDTTSSVAYADVENCVQGKDAGVTCDDSGIGSDGQSGLPICYFNDKPNDGVSIDIALLAASTQITAPPTG